MVAAVAGAGAYHLLVMDQGIAVQQAPQGGPGANDYLAKPFRLSDLLARVRAQLRVYDNSEDASFLVGPYDFHPSVRLLQEPTRNRKIRLTGKECAILKFLYRAGGKPVPRPVLLNEVWGYSSAVTTHTLETNVYQLRQKIEADPAQPRLVITDNGGYRLDTASLALTGR